MTAAAATSYQCLWCVKFPGKSFCFLQNFHCLKCKKVYPSKPKVKWDLLKNIQRTLMETEYRPLKNRKQQAAALSISHQGHFGSHLHSSQPVPLPCKTPVYCSPLTLACSCFSLSEHPTDPTDPSWPVFSKVCHWCLRFSFLIQKREYVYRIWIRYSLLPVSTQGRKVTASSNLGSPLPQRDTRAN